MQGRMAQDILGYPWWYVVAGLWTVLGSVWWVGDTIQGLLKHAREVEQFTAEAAERKRQMEGADVNDGEDDANISQFALACRTPLPPDFDDDWITGGHDATRLLAAE